LGEQYVVEMICERDRQAYTGRGKGVVTIACLKLNESKEKHTNKLYTQSIITRRCKDIFM